MSKGKVVVGMSGGVDSSVAAILLKNEGYEVIGLFMRNWDSSLNNDFLGKKKEELELDICPQEKDYNDAIEVCKKIGIPLHRVDFVKEYWDYVFTYFLNELKAGRTPNPDVMCNKYIKFDYFIKEAKKLGANYVATGHYANTKDNNLYMAKDANKDQTYFLSMLSSKQLDHVLFPLGNLEKTEVRKIASDYGLITAAKKDSTGICFIGERNFKEFLKNYFPVNKGKIINIENGGVVGEHSGLMYYTIGQRKGLNLGGNSDKMFIVGKNINENILYVAPGEDNNFLYSDSTILENMNFISDTRPLKCKAKFRYRAPLYDVNIEYLDNGYIKLNYNNVKAVTPGQICVLYDGELCIGGGIIKEVYKDNKKIWYL